MGVYEDLLGWSLERPLWQRHALRRLTEGGLTDADVRELADIAVATARGDRVESGSPLEATHLPTSPAGTEVRLLSLSHVENVNALAPGEELSFGRDGLTVVYGDNASGKSGYVRVLKKLCRARAAGGPIHPNVFRRVEGSPLVRAAYSLGGEEREAEWSPNMDPPDDLAAVSVYDRDCASVYVTGENEVAYRPFGLDLLDQLAETAERVRAEIDRRRRERGRAAVEVPPDVQNAPVFSDHFPLRGTSDPDAVLANATWSEGNERELDAVERALGAENPARLAGALTASRNALVRLRDLLRLRQSQTSTEAVGALREARRHHTDITVALRALRDDVLADLPGADSPTWRELWEAARRWSEEVAFPDHRFPHIGEGATCVLCGQSLSEETERRFSRLDEFVESDLSAQARESATAVRAAEAVMEQLRAAAASDSEVVRETTPDRPALATSAREFLSSCEARGVAALAASTDEDWDALPAAASPPLDELSGEIEELKTQIDLLQRAMDPGNLQLMREQRSALLAKRWIVQNGQAIRAEIARLQELGVLNSAASTCTTNAITAESTRLTDRYVTQELASSFEQELGSLQATQVRVRVTRRGQRGVAYHRIELRDPQVAGVRVQEVFSEGEFGAVGLAAFLAETGQAEASSIVLDDPVSSFDHLHRRNAARRLADEARRRQVVVFTHDIVFLSNLESAASEFGVPTRVLNLRVRAEGAGVPEAGPPWTAQRVSARIGRLQDDLARARRFHEDGDMETYQLHARNWYGNLRETWERAVEEVLFAEVVVRYRHGVETARAGRQKIWLIEEADIRTLDSAMTKASGQIRGHDQPGAVNDPVPAPAELMNDLQVLQGWVNELQGRRR